MPAQVFLVYDPIERSQAERVAAELTAIGVQPDMEWEFETDGQWSEQMETDMGKAAACVLLLGPSGPGPAGSIEMRLFLARLAAQGAPVLAILLPGATPEEVPLFLQGHPLLDLRQDPDMLTLPRLLRDQLNHRDIATGA